MRMAGSRIFIHQGFEACTWRSFSGVTCCRIFSSSREFRSSSFFTCSQLNVFFFGVRNESHSNTMSRIQSLKSSMYKTKQNNTQKDQKSAVYQEVCLSFPRCHEAQGKITQGTGRQHCVEVQTHRWRVEWQLTESDKPTKRCDELHLTELETTRTSNQTTQEQS